MSEPGVVIIGAGGHARVVAEALQGPPAGHLSPHDDAPEGLGPWLGGDDAAAALAASGHVFVIGTGFVDRSGAERRSRLLAALQGLELATVVHPAAFVSRSCSVGPGAYVGPGAVVGSGVELGRGVIINTGAIVDHDCRIADNVHIGPGVALSGDVHVGADTLIGVGSAVRQGLRIGSRVVVGAGAAVTGDLADGVTAVGVPARATDATR